MTTNQIVTSCPKCSHTFPLNELIAKDIQTKVAQETKEIIRVKEDQIGELRSQVSAAENSIQVEAQKIAQKEVKIALVNQARLFEEQKRIHLLSKDEEIKNATENLLTAQRNELALRKKIIEVEQREKQMDLEVERGVSDRIFHLREAITKQVAQDFHQKDVERESLISDLRRQLVEMKHKTELGSQQSRGESFEVEIGSRLRRLFPTDKVEDVPKGVVGADLIQNVVGSSGHSVGKIVWEVKNTKIFQPAWIDKLKDDRNALGAEVGILVTASMPKGKTGAYLDQGVWIVEHAMITSVAQMARQSLIEVHQVVTASCARHEKADILYSYLTNPVFRQRLEAIVESFHQMREDLDREKRAISKSWKQRERQLDAMVENTVQIYSDVQLVVGQKVLNIPLLEMPTDAL